MDEKIALPPPRPPSARRSNKEAAEAKEGDKKLDDYDKAVADSFPASDPPAQPSLEGPPGA